MPALEATRRALRRIDKSTASHRPTLMLPTLLLSQFIEQASLESAHDGEQIPLDATRREAISLLAEVPLTMLGRPEIDSFYGEIHVHWAKGSKQIVLMCFADRSPLVHHHLRLPNAPSQHGIEVADGKSLVSWLRWLRT